VETQPKGAEKKTIDQGPKKKRTMTVQQKKIKNGYAKRRTYSDQEKTGEE